MQSSDLGVLDGRLFLGDDDFVVWNCKTEGHGIFDGKLHFHDFYEMSFIYSGSGSYEVNGRRFPVERGFWLLSTPSDCHRLSVSPGECLRYYNVIFRENQIAREISDRLYRLTLPLCLTLPGEAPPLSEDFARLLADYFVYAEKGDELSRRLVKNQVENLCLRFVVLLKQLPAPAAVNFPPTAHRSKAAEPSKPIKSTTVTDSRESTDAKKSTFPVKSTASAETPVSMASPTSMGAGDEPPAAGHGSSRLPLPTPLPVGEEDEILRKTLLFIRENYRSPLPLSRIADAVELSPGYLSSYFKRSMKIGLSEYICRYRLVVAAGYLASGDMPLKEVALLNGFRSPGYFSAAFSAYFGVSPREYRKNVR